MAIDSIESVPPPADNYKDRVQKSEQKDAQDSQDQAEETSVRKVPSNNSNSRNSAAKEAPPENDEAQNINLLA